MRRIPLFLFLLLFLSQSVPPAAFGSTSPMDVPPQNVESDFHLLNEREGWLLLNQHLYWTTTGGDTWQEITPAVAPATIQVVFFLNARTGWVVSSRATSTDSVAYSLARTLDGGKSWQNQALSLFRPGDVQPPTRAVSLFFVDAETGWLVLRQATNSNFIVGTLFRTGDGGKSWSRLSIPIAEPVYFINRTIGWAAGGPAGDQLFRSPDGGRSWQPQIPRDPSTPSQRRFYQLPRFKNDREGVLFVLAPDGAKTQVEVYRSRDGGATWNLDGRVPIDQPVSFATDLPLAIFDPDDWLLLAPQRQTVLSRSLGGDVATAKSRDDKTTGVHRLEMGSRQVGWGWYSAGDCTFTPGTASRSKANVKCTREDALVKTKDGGQTWQTITLPGAAASQVGRNALSASQYMQAQGFDKCEVADLNQLQTWWSSSPYDAVNLYIGGVNRHCDNTPLNASYVAQMHNQGWKFIPTWVGRQAPCTGDSYPHKFDYNTTTAYSQGVSEANDAANAAANLGLMAGGVIYVDIEWYDAAKYPSCRSAVNAFVSGWSGQMRARGYYAGAYGATCAGMTDWAEISNKPDAIWGARWNYLYYNSSASVWDLPCLSNELWKNHQRIHQYTGGHGETWGGVTLIIDSDVIDGMVADTGNNPPLVPSYPSPYDGEILDATARPTLYWSTNGTTCDVHVWGGDVGDSTSSGGSCSGAFFGAHYGGAYQWQITARNSYGSTTGPIWHFDVRPRPPTNVQATLASGTQVTLTWTLSLGDPTHIDNYTVYRAGVLYTTVPKGSTALTVDVACALDTFYVTSLRQGVASLPSNAARVTIPGCPYLYLPLMSQ